MQFHPEDLSELDDLTEEHLGFSALSDGLGFSRTAKKAPNKAAKPEKNAIPDFEEEEDNNPELQQKAISGTGAVAAGFARPAPYNPVRPAKTAPNFTAPSFPSYTQHATAAPARPIAAASVLSMPAASQALRVQAFLADVILVTAPMALAWVLNFGKQSWEMFQYDRSSTLLVLAVIVGAYFLLTESFGGQSLGKMYFGLRIVEDDKYQKPIGLRHSTVRLLLLVLGTALLGLGLFASFWDAKKRPWQDRLSGSIVRRKN